MKDNGSRSDRDCEFDYCAAVPESCSGFLLFCLQSKCNKILILLVSSNNLTLRDSHMYCAENVRD